MEEIKREGIGDLLAATTAKAQYSVREISGLLGTCDGTVRMLLRRALIQRLVWQVRAYGHRVWTLTADEQVGINVADTVRLMR
ncbi:hypothetical protein FAZ95_36630 [Trinickia violacea]|uniref:Uncharacterized protein n=1 Tax=Trinickia violacea TaxID=2571746 RepID=A0A4P8IYM3_9BURK|nr:hypothetical protein [Trinickia violacea]QCP54442.1 hypothetical protein FAZ95_36630 [Trinickia violacea]